MSQKTTYTTLQQTVSLIGGLCGMAAVARFALGYGLGLLAQNVAQFGGDLFVDGRDLPGAIDSISGLNPVGLTHGTMPQQRSGKCSFRFSVLTSD